MTDEQRFKSKSKEEIHNFMMAMAAGIYELSEGALSVEKVYKHMAREFKKFTGYRVGMYLTHNDGREDEQL